MQSEWQELGKEKVLSFLEKPGLNILVDFYELYLVSQFFLFVFDFGLDFV